MKVGDKVMFLDITNVKWKGSYLNNYECKNMTIGKVYEILKITKADYLVINDKGEYDYYIKERFEIARQRKEKLERILK